MIIWINGSYGSGKTQTAYELQRRLDNSYVYDPENIGYFLDKNLPTGFSKISQGNFQNCLECIDKLGFSGAFKKLVCIYEELPHRLWRSSLSKGALG